VCRPLAFVKPGALLLDSTSCSVLGSERKFGPQPEQGTCAQGAIPTKTAWVRRLVDIGEASSQAMRKRRPAALSAEDSQEFQNTRTRYPDLSESDFRTLKEYSRQLHAIGKEVSVETLESTLQKHNGDMLAALKDKTVGASGKQARSMVAAHRR